MKKRNIIILTSVILMQCIYSMDTPDKSYVRLPLSMQQKQIGYITNPLSSIEKLLIVSAIQERGKKSVLYEIKKDRSWDAPSATLPVVLHIKRIFHLAKLTQCPLTRSVFAGIRAVEEKSWYCTRVTQHYQDGRLVAVQAPTNYLGDNTRYVWNTRYVKTNGRKTKTDESSVVVNACFTEERKDLLLEFVKNYDVGCGIK